MLSIFLLNLESFLFKYHLELHLLLYSIFQCKENQLFVLILYRGLTALQKLSIGTSQTMDDLHLREFPKCLRHLHFNDARISISTDKYPNYHKYLQHRFPPLCKYSGQLHLFIDYQVIGLSCENPCNTMQLKYVL